MYFLRKNSLQFSIQHCTDQIRLKISRKRRIKCLNSSRAFWLWKTLITAAPDDMWNPTWVYLYNYKGQNTTGHNDIANGERTMQPIDMRESTHCVWMTRSGMLGMWHEICRPMTSVARLHARRSRSFQLEYPFSRLAATNVYLHSVWTLFHRCPLFNCWWSKKTIQVGTRSSYNGRWV